jgi:hypothetical protein
MAATPENVSERRRALAPSIASILYGVIAIMSVDIAAQPDRLGRVEAVLGVLLLGLAMMATRMLVRIVTREAEIGAHLPITEISAIAKDALLVLLFPVATALLIAGTAFVTTAWEVLLDAILYFGLVAVFTIGFLSSYILHQEFRSALSRGLFWFVMVAIAIALKKLS